MEKKFLNVKITFLNVANGIAFITYIEPNRGNKRQRIKRCGYFILLLIYTRILRSYILFLFHILLFYSPSFSPILCFCSLLSCVTSWVFCFRAFYSKSSNEEVDIW